MELAGKVSPEKIAEVLQQIRTKGVRLWSQNGRLHYKSPKGVLTREELHLLQMSKTEIIALFETSGNEESIHVGKRPALIPLSYSQLSHWYLYRLSERKTIRQIASATRMTGPLDLAALKQSVTEIVRRHEALRTRIVLRDGIPTQEIDPPHDCRIQMEDLSQISSAECSQAISRLTDQLIMDPIDLSVGPLFEVRLLKLHDDEHVLIAVMEHMISDGFSMNIFLSELFTAYTQATKGQAFSLPEVQIQFADYALEQKSAHLGWLKRHDHYWQERLPRLQRLRFPVDDSVSSAAPPGWGMVPFQISGGTKAALRDWCRARKTTLVMSVFTSFVAAALRWCNATEGTFQYQTDGRSSPRTENSIGFFAWPLYLAVSLREQDSFTDLLNRITQEYCQAYERADHCFYESRALRPEFAKSCAFNWVPQQGTQSEGSSPGHSDVTVTWSPVAFEHPMLKRLNRDNEPVLLLYETDDEIDAGIYFPRARFSEPYIERFAQTVLRFLQHQHSYPEARIKDVPTL